MDKETGSGEPPRGTALQHLPKCRNDKPLYCFEEPGGRGSDDENEWKFPKSQTKTPSTDKGKPAKPKWRHKSTLALLEKYVQSTIVIDGVEYQRCGKI
jgi:hypothetical protein